MPTDESLSTVRNAQFHPNGSPQLCVNVAEMAPYCFLADRQLGCDFLVSAARADGSHDLCLTRCQARRPLVLQVPKLPEDVAHPMYTLRFPRAGTKSRVRTNQPYK